MAIKDLLVHLDPIAASTNRLEMALALAEACAAQLAALCLVAEPFLRGMAGHHMPTELLRQHLAEAEREADAILDAARQAADRRNIVLTARRESGPLDRLPSLLAHQARHTDLTIVGQPNLEEGGVDDALLAEAAFMDTGGPALVVPYASARPLPPKRVLIAWDGSREAARAVRDAIPLLRFAGETVILVGGRDLSEHPSDQPGAGIVTHLARHEIRSRVKQVPSGGASASELILAQARDESADLVVMGGYGHSRLRERLLGGTTRFMLEHMTVPVLFSH